MKEIGVEIRQKIQLGVQTITDIIESINALKKVRNCGELCAAKMLYAIPAFISQGYRFGEVVEKALNYLLAQAPNIHYDASGKIEEYSLAAEAQRILASEKMLEQSRCLMFDNPATQKLWEFLSAWQKNTTDPSYPLVIKKPPYSRWVAEYCVDILGTFEGNNSLKDAQPITGEDKFLRVCLGWGLGHLMTPSHSPQLISYMTNFLSERGVSLNQALITYQPEKKSRLVLSSSFSPADFGEEMSDPRVAEFRAAVGLIRALEGQGRLRIQDTMTSRV